jgi:hypothetical protein
MKKYLMHLRENVLDNDEYVEKAYSIVLFLCVWKI